MIGLQKVLQYSQTRFNDYIVKLFDNEHYIQRGIEQQIVTKLRAVFANEDKFGLIVYGPKGVGKTTVLRKVLLDQYPPPTVGWYQGIAQSLHLTRNQNQASPCVPIYVELGLGGCQKTEDVLDKITTDMLGKNTGAHLTTVLMEVKKELESYNSNLLLYLHINGMPPIVTEGEPHPFQLLDQIIRTVANSPGIGVLIELSKSWFPAVNQRMYFL